MPARQSDPLSKLIPLLDEIKRAHGPYLIVPPTTAEAPVAILLPANAIRYCDNCKKFKPAAQMRNIDHCQTCLGKTPRRARVHK
jgi:hypothetical protein